MAVNPGRSLYRAMLRAALRVPEENKRNLALDRIRTDFRCGVPQTHPMQPQRLFRGLSQEGAAGLCPVAHVSSWESAPSIEPDADAQI